MKPPSFFPLLLLFAAIAAPVRADDFSADCAKRRSYLEQQLAASSDADVVLLRASGPSVRLVILAESHLRRPMDLLVRTLAMMKTADPELNCLFLEAYAKDQPLIDGYLSSRFTREQTLAGAASSSLMGDELPLFDAAKRLGLGVHAVDTPLGLDKTPSLLAKSILMRNAHMSEAVSDALQNGRCRKAVMLLGKVHVMTSIVNPSETDRRSVLQRVRSRGLAVAAINVIHRGAYTAQYGDELAPQHCSWNLWDGMKAGSTALGFTPLPPTPAIEGVFDTSQSRFVWDDAPRWEQYDGVIVQP
jgi:hypothetical protein